MTKQLHRRPHPGGSRLWKAAGNNLMVVLLAVALLCFPAAHYLQSVIDGPDIPYFGSPLPWNARGQWTSLSKDIFVLPLLFNLLCYWMLARLVLRALERLPRLPRLVAKLGLSLWGLLCAFTLATWLLVGQNAFHLVPGSWSLRMTGIGLGMMG